MVKRWTYKGSRTSGSFLNIYLETTLVLKQNICIKTNKLYKQSLDRSALTLSIGPNHCCSKFILLNEQVCIYWRLLTYVVYCFDIMAAS